MFILLRYVILTLRGPNRLRASLSTSYELCARVYQIGFEEFSTLVYQDRDIDFLVSSNLHVVNGSRAAFDQVYQVIKHLQEQRQQAPPPPPPPGSPPVVGTVVEWDYGPKATKNAGRLELSSVTDAINVMIPMILSSPVVNKNVVDYISVTMHQSSSLAHEQRNFKLLSYKQEMFQAFFCLGTKEFSNAYGCQAPRGLCSLSKVVMTREGLLSKEDTDLVVGDGVRPQRDKGDLRQREEEIVAANRQMNEWIVDEKGVMVTCRVYVYVVLCIAIIMVGGGIAIGVTLGGRLPGADPFSIATYFWVLATFLILVAKSVKVTDWPWRDFFLGRVFCRSVSELHAVTKVDPQIILAKLLHDEPASLLQTRGPYNGVFNRKSEDGFSIDVPLAMKTLPLSGLIMLEVQRENGTALVCLNARRDNSVAVLQNHNKGVHTNMVCEYVRGESRLSKRKQRLRLTRSKMKWHRINGIYTRQDHVFV